MIPCFLREAAVWTGWSNGKFWCCFSWRWLHALTSCYWFTLSDYMNESASFVSINILLAIWILCYYYFFLIVRRRSESRWITFPRIGRFGSWRGRFRINYHFLNQMMWFESNSTKLEKSLRSGFFFRLQRKLDYKDRCTECEAAILKA